MENLKASDGKLIAKWWELRVECESQVIEIYRIVVQCESQVMEIKIYVIKGSKIESNYERAEISYKLVYAFLKD